MKDDDPVRLLPISDVQLLSTMSSAEQFIDPFQPTAGTQLQRTRLQYFEEVVFVLAMLEFSFTKFDHSAYSRPSYPTLNTKTAE